MTSRGRATTGGIIALAREDVGRTEHYSLFATSYSGWMRAVDWLACGTACPNRILANSPEIMGPTRNGARTRPSV